EPMNFLSVIESKREGEILGSEQIKSFVAKFTTGKIPDYQMAAMLMAIYFRGLNSEETRALTFAMRDSGDVLKFPNDSRPLVDKHSTGGVGDKVSLPLAPLLACLGFRVPMISGRGLGITGGTLDKLASIPGFRTALSLEEIVAQVQSVGCVICGQTEKMVPADKKMYALRDVTGTIPSIPLITASILSKKLAENLDALVLDVKFGSAAFMQTAEAAHELAQAMVLLGNECGVNTRAVLTDMNTPIGRAAGNWLEVKESVACLDAVGMRSTVSQISSEIFRDGVETVPADLRELVIDFAAHLLVQTKHSTDLKAARQKADECLRSGAPRRKWDEMLAAQGADLDAFNRKLSNGSTSSKIFELKSNRSGFVSGCDARIIGEAVRDLGGGRLQKDSAINFDVGIDQIAKPGEKIQAGEILARIHAADQPASEATRMKLQSAFTISGEPPSLSPLILEII
ncbi:MAG: thymidine phosphorylase, partial [Verrucomicrobiota bacterium]